MQASELCSGVSYMSVKLLGPKILEIYLELAV